MFVTSKKAFNMSLLKYAILLMALSPFHFERGC